MRVKINFKYFYKNGILCIKVNADEMTYCTT